MSEFRALASDYETPLVREDRLKENEKRRNVDSEFRDTEFRDIPIRAGTRGEPYRSVIYGTEYGTTGSVQHRVRNGYSFSDI